MTDQLSFDVSLALPPDQTIERVTAALKEQGFGILTRIDVHQAFEEKLGAKFRPYVILGACSPPLAHQALTSEPRVGLFLPCNVTVEEAAGGSLVRIIDPNAMLSVGPLADDPALQEVAAAAREKLSTVARILAEG